MDILKKILPFSGIIIFIFILWKGIDLKNVAIVFAHINIFYLILAMLFTFLIIFFKVKRIYKILQENNISISFIDFLEIYANTNILAQVTNLLFSETTAAIATMHKQDSKTRIANIYLLCNVTDFSVIILLCMFSLLLNYKFVMNILTFNVNGSYNIFLFIFCFFIVAMFLMLIFYSKIVVFVQKVINDIKDLFKISFNTLVLFTIAVYISYLLACYFEAKVFNIHLDFFYLLLVYTLGSLIGVIPISINGLGTREAAFIFFMNIKQITNESAFALSLFAFVFAPLTVYLCLYFYVLVRKRLFKINWL